MATTIRDLLVKLGVDAEGADADVAKLDKGLTDLKDIMTGVVVVAAAVTAAIAGVAASAASAGDQVDKGAQAAAVSTDAYQELAFMASQAGTTIEIVTKALGKQTTALGQLQIGTGMAGERLDALGLTYAQLAALSPDQQFAATADAMALLGSEQEILQAATAVYGEDMAQKLLPLLKAGGEGMAAMAAQAHELGLVMSEDQIATAVVFTDTWDQVWKTITAVKNAIGLALLPTLTDLLVKVREWYAANRELIATKLDQWVGVLVAGIESLGRMATAVDATVQRVFGGWRPILIGLAALAAGVAAAFAGFAAIQAGAALSTIMAAVAGIGGATIAAVAGQILAVVAAVVLLYLAVDDLIVFLSGGDSALGRFLDTFRSAEGPLGAAARLFETLISVGSKVIDLLAVLGGAWWAVFSRTALPVLKLVGAALMWVAEKAMGLLGWYWDNVVGPMWQAFGAAIDWLLAKLDGLQPSIAWLMSQLDGLLAMISAVTGVDVTVGGQVGTSPPPGASSAAASAAFAPSGSEALGSLGSFGAAAAAAGPVTRELTVQGNTYTITGTGWTEEKVLGLITKAEAERARATSAALEGAEV